MNLTPFFHTIISMFVLLIIGFIAGKTKIIDSIASKKLSALIIKVGQPALIIYSLVKVIDKDMKPEEALGMVKLGMQTLLFGFAVHIAMAVVAFLVCLKFKDIDERKLTEFTMIFGNVGFLGIPVLESLLDSTGAFMGAFFIVSFNVFLWTWGICILARKRKDIKLTPKKLLNFGTVPCLIGFIFFLVIIFIKWKIYPAFELPLFVSKSFEFTSSLCTPISMLIIGALLATRSLKQIFCTWKIYLLTAVKLILLPLAVCLFLKLVGLDNWIIFAAAVISMPSATTVTMLAELYDINPGYSAQAVGTTSIFSVATMPLVMILAQKIAEL